MYKLNNVHILKTHQKVKIFLVNEEINTIGTAESAFNSVKIAEVFYI